MKSWCLFVPPAETLPYANGVLPAEIILVFILAAIEALRLFFGERLEINHLPLLKCPLGKNILQKKQLTMPGFDCLFLSDLCKFTVENGMWQVIRGDCFNRGIRYGFFIQMIKYFFFLHSRLFWHVQLFSSPEHKVLRVSYCDRPLSVVRRRASSVVRRASCVVRRASSVNFFT